ncbi:MAG: hypothetical protein WCB12_18855 [Bryobacteraceae bacterium]
MFARSSAQFSLIRDVAARLFLAAGLFGGLAFTPQARAQTVLVHVSAVPAGAYFMVDNQTYNSTQSFAWPVGSQHTLVVASTIQPYILAPTVYTFVNWSAGSETFTSPSIMVMANPSVTQYTANFSTTYTLNAIVSSTCGAVPCGGSPGTIFVNGIAEALMVPPLPQPYAAGSSVILVAVTNPGYTFTGWTPGANQLITGEQDTVTMNGPVVAVANFTLAAPVTFASVPSGLEVLVDSQPTVTPSTEWLAWGSVHALSTISQQKDATGNLWVFASWSDGGAISHNLTVPQSSAPVTLTATFTPGVLNTFLTSPPRLNLTVDGRSNWTNWNFAWALGSTHTFAAPATETDAQGRLWSFTGWSNGGAAAQTVTVTTGGTYTATYQQLAQLTVSSSLPGISVSVNGTSCATPCTVQPPVGSQVTITAPASVPVSANSRQDLLGWSTGAAAGNLTLTAPASATTVTANYHLMNYLATATNPAGAATWNLQPASPDGYYDYRTVVNISLSPLPGYQFRNWSGDLNGITPFGMLLMSQPRSVTALFATIPYLPDGAVTNAVGTTPSSAVAPGSAISIFGANLADDVKVNLASSMPQTLDGVTVSIAGRLLPLYYVSPTQINAQLPADLPLGASNLVVTTPEQAQVTSSFTIAQDAPGLFAVTSNDKAYALAFHPDGTLVTEASPAKAGEALTLYGTGFGPTTPLRPEGLPVPKSPSYVVTDPASVQVGTASFAAQSAYAMPGAVGIDVVEFALGADAPSGGDFQITVTINKVVSNAVLLPIQ